MVYSFYVEHAKKYGVNEAILIYNFIYWIMKNKANNKHYYEGRIWTYNSLNAFAKLFPFWTKRQIERIINSLIEQKVIVKDNFNKSRYDRTNWYAFTNEFMAEISNLMPQVFNHSDLAGDIMPFHQTEKSDNENLLTSTDDKAQFTKKVKSIEPNGEIHSTKRCNPSRQTVPPIPDNKPNNKPDKKLNNKNTYTQNKSFAHSHVEDVNLSCKEKEKEKEKKQHLDYVMLTNDEYQNLVTRLGKETADHYIQCLNDYIHQIGIRRANAKYKSHYHVILNWKRMDDAKIKQRLLVAEAMKKKEEDKWFT